MRPQMYQQEKRMMSNWPARSLAIALLATATISAWAENAIRSISSTVQAGAEVVRGGGATAPMGECYPAAGRRTVSRIKESVKALPGAAPNTTYVEPRRRIAAGGSRGDRTGPYALRRRRTIPRAPRSAESSPSIQGPSTGTGWTAGRGIAPSVAPRSA